jgi:hypothetical protein
MGYSSIRHFQPNLISSIREAKRYQHPFVLQILAQLCNRAARASRRSCWSARSLGQIAHGEQHKQQLARLGIQDEQQPLQHDQGVVVDLLERGRVGRECVAGLVEEPLCQLLERIVDLAFQRLAHATRVGRAFLQQCVKADWPCSNALRWKNA